MAIAFDNGSSGNATGTSLTIAHTCTGTNLVLRSWVVQADNGSDTVTGATYNGVAMTLLTKFEGLNSGGNDAFFYLFELVNPSTGVHNVVFSSSASHFLVGANASYTGAQQSPVYSGAGQTDRIVTTVPTLSSISVSTSALTIANNAWATYFVRLASSLSNARTGNSFTTLITNTNQFTQQFAGWDNSSNGAITPAGTSYTMTVNTNSGTDLIVGGSGAVMVTLSPAGFVPPSTTNSGYFFAAAQ